MDCEKNFLIGNYVKGKRTFNGEVIEGKFNGFRLYNKLNPKSVVGVIDTDERCYDVSVDSIELVESEDKRIRKDIIAFIERNKRPIAPVPADDTLDRWIAWLEKQGEKTNPYSGISFEYNGHIWGMCAREGGVDILCDSQLIKHIENQGEQNPADNVDVLMSLDEAIEHCKEKSCGNNACALEHKHLEKWLTELKELKEQNSSWSEEDEGMIECIIAAIKMGDYYTQDELNRMTSWLKSLKPNHWKPSQKQMEALKKECLAHSNYQLCRLLEELEKL